MRRRLGGAWQKAGQAKKEEKTDLGGWLLVMMQKTQGHVIQLSRVIHVKGDRFPWGFDSAMALSRIPSVGFVLPSLALLRNPLVLLLSYFFLIFFFQGIFSAYFTLFMPRRHSGVELLMKMVKLDYLMW